MTIDSSALPLEKNPEPGGFLPYALAISLLVHGWVLGALAPGSAHEPDERGVVEVRIQGRLLPPPAFAGATKPVPDQKRSGQGAAVPIPARERPRPAAVATDIVPASRGFPVAAAADVQQPEPATGAAGGTARAQALREPATVALADEQRARGPDAAGLRQFRLALAGEARRLRRYPEAARRAGLSGTAEVRVAVESGGAVRRTDLIQTSGHELLDVAAVEMLREAATRAFLPDSLRGVNFAVLLPVVFEVED